MAATKRKRASVVEGFQPRVLASPQQLQALEEDYKGRLTENSQLTKAARLAAEQEVLLNSDVPPDMKVAMLKPLSRQVRKWTKIVRQPGLIDSGDGAGGGGDDEARGPLTNLLTQLIKTRQPRSKAQTSAKTQTPRKPPVPPKPKRLTFATPESESVRALTERTRQLVEQSQRQRRRVKTELEKLRRPPGWLDWDKKVKRKLDGSDY